MAGIDKIFSLGKGLLMKNADDLLKVRPQEKIEVFKELVERQADGMTLWSELDKNAPRVHQSPGMFLRKARVLLKSVPTQKHIDEMLDTAHTEKVSARMKEIAEKKFGYVNPKRVLQAKEGFERGVRWTEPTPVKLESRYTKDVIEDMYAARMKAADDYLRAESLGTALPEAVMKRREDVFEALSKYAPESPAYGDTYIGMASRKIKEIFKYAENGTGKVNVTEALEALKVTPKGREYDKARAGMLKMIDKAIKGGKEVTAYKTIDTAEFDAALSARGIKFVDAPRGRIEDIDPAVLKRFGLEL